MSSRHGPRVRLIGSLRLAVAAALSVTALAAVPSNAAPNNGCGVNPDKCFTFTIDSYSPNPAHTGEDITYNATIKNTSKVLGNIRLGSANVTANGYERVFDAAFASPLAQGQISTSGTTVALRQLNLAANQSVSFSFKAFTLYYGEKSFTAEAKQSNDFNGTGNNLTWSNPGASSTVQVDDGCYGDAGNEETGTYEACGEEVITSSGGNVSSGNQTEGGGDSRVTASLEIPPAQVDPWIARIRTDVPGNPDCVETPVLNVPCTYVVTLDSKIPTAYDLDHSITMTIHCDPSLCGDGPLPPVMLQVYEDTGQKTVLPYCIEGGEEALLAATGSYACIDPSSTINDVIIRGITYLNDWKVANFDTDSFIG